MRILAVLSSDELISELIDHIRASQEPAEASSADADPESDNSEAFDEFTANLDDASDESNAALLTEGEPEPMTDQATEAEPEPEAEAEPEPEAEPEATV